MLIKKRDGSLEIFNEDKIKNAITKAAKAADETVNLRELLDYVLRMVKLFSKNTSNIPTVELIQDLIEEALIDKGYSQTAKHFIIYREQRRKARDSKQLLDGTKEMIDNYINGSDWRIKENSNMAYSLQGLNNHITSAVTAHYWLHEIYPEEIREAHYRGDFHLHDLGLLSVYCCGWDLEDLLRTGFTGVEGKIASKPPKHFSAALGQIVNFIYTLQGEAAGAQALSSFDTLLSPFIYYDQLSYEEVKQAMQEFIFNMNVPTRVGFQCLSEDTEILTPDGWKSHTDIQEGSTIYTFNLKNKTIEQKVVDKIFKYHHSGTMYNLKSRSMDQLISPNHRIVRKVWNKNSYVLEPIEEAMQHKSPLYIPTTSVPENVNDDVPMSDTDIKLLAWFLSEGSIENKGNWCRVAFYQSKDKHKEYYNEILSLLNELNLTYTESEQYSFSSCGVIRLNADSSRYIRDCIMEGSTKKIFPKITLKFSKRQAKLFIDTYFKGDGTQYKKETRRKITTVREDFKDYIVAIAILAGYTVSKITVREPEGVRKQPLYKITISESKSEMVSKIEKINYEGIIWSVHTDNETVIARRNGTIFITGNSPFSNLTMDLVVPSTYKDKYVIVGGEIKDKTYSEFQYEMNMINKAFAEIMLEGDANGRIFSFPIPTYNISKDFQWDNPAFDKIWEMTAKRGVPYFANFVNSDMNPEDARSMCLHPEEELIFRTGGPVYGDIGRASIKEVVNKFRLTDFDDEGWAACKDYLEVLTLNTDTGQLEWNYVKQFLKITDNKEVIITTSDGKTVRMSTGHVVSVIENDDIVLKKASDLKTGDKVISVVNVSNWKNRYATFKASSLEFDEDLAVISGYFYANGSYIHTNPHNSKFSKLPYGLIFRVPLHENEDGAENLIKLLNKREGATVYTKTYDDKVMIWFYDRRITQTFFLYPFHGGIECRFPTIVFNSPKTVMKCFLDAFLAGCGYSKSKIISFKGDEVSRDIVLLSTLLGKKVLYKQSDDKHIIEFIEEDDNKASISDEVNIVTIERIELVEHEENIDFYDVEIENNHLFMHSLGTITHNCCRLRLDNRELVKRGGGLFGSNPLTGSISVVTINLPRLGYTHRGKSKHALLHKLSQLMELAKESLIIKRKTLERLTEQGLYPYSKFYLRDIKKRTGKYWANHFNTIGLIGMHECCLNYLGKGIETEEGRKFALEILSFMRDKLKEFQLETGELFNLEATPGEGLSYRLPLKDKKEFPDIITSGDKEPYYTNSTQLPVDYTTDIFEVLKHQDDLQCMYTGGTVLHIFLGESINDPEVCKALVQRITSNYRLPYISITPTFTICPVHGFIEGEHHECPYMVEVDVDEEGNIVG